MKDDDDDDALGLPNSFYSIGVDSNDSLATERHLVAKCNIYVACGIKVTSE